MSDKLTKIAFKISNKEWFMPLISGSKTIPILKQRMTHSFSSEQEARQNDYLTLTEEEWKEYRDCVKKIKELTNKAYGKKVF